MKKSYFSVAIAVCALSFTLLAQAPQGVNYQAVARDAGGVALVNQPIAIRISITDGNGGALLYQETHSATTNTFGLFTLNIGNGTAGTGIFSAINWQGVNAWVSVDMDPAGGTNWTTMGSSQLLSVPYALHSATSADNKWTSNSTNIYNLNNGNVGIGTNNPFSKLSVVQSSGSVAYFGQTSNASPADAVQIDNYSDGSSLACSAFGNGHAAYFGAMNAGSSSNAVFAQSNGSGNSLGGIHSGSGVAVYGYQTGIGRAAFFQIDNSISTVPALTSLSNGYGAAGYFANSSIGAGPALITGGGNVGIGTNTPSAKLHVNGTFRLTDGTQAQDKVLTTDAFGNASWSALPANPTVNSGFKVYSSTSQTVASGVLTQVSWTEDYDDAGAFSGDAFTAPANGVYHFDVNLMGDLSNTASPNYFQEVKLKKNGVIVATSYGSGFQNAGTQYSYKLNTDIKLNAGDVITVWVTQYAFGGLTMTLFPTEEYCWFSGHRVY